MNLMERMVEQARANKQRIVLPEGTEERTLQAADRILADNIADIILIGEPSEIMELADRYKLKHIDKATLVNPTNHEKKETYTQLLYELTKTHPSTHRLTEPRTAKGVTLDKAETLVEDPLFLGCLMIKNGDADGEVAGARNTTGNVLRSAFQIIKTAPGVKVVSGAFLMFVPDRSYGEDGLMVFADCAVLPNPTASELAQIAVSTAKTARDIANIDPRIAMLSFSSKGSASHEMVDKVVEATRLAKEMEPSLKIDGELQTDAAIVPAVGASKAPGSEIAGHANVLVFPSLEVGNIAYKLVQRLAHAEAVGPILQGIAAPVNDLSRGCSVDDIYKMIAITCNQAISLKK